MSETDATGTPEGRGTPRPAGRRAAPRSGGRSPWQRISPVALIGGGAVLATTLTLLGVADPVPVVDTADRPPAAVPLEEAVLVCPPATTPVTLARPLAEAAAPVQVRSARGESTVEVAATGTAPARGSGFLTATGDAAPALLAARVGDTPAPFAAECAAPGGEWWFAGVGAGGNHTSVVQLANPDDEPAVADLEVWSADGPVAVEDLRGLAVEGRGRRTIDLAELVPLREAAVLRVVVRQGRLAAAVADTVEDGNRTSSDSVAATAAPAVRQVLPAVPTDLTEVAVVVANPGADTGRAEVRVSGADSEAAPLGMEQIPVGAGEAVVVPLNDATLDLLSAGGASLVVEGTVPVVAGLRGRRNGDVVQLSAAVPAGADSGAVLPRASNRQLVLSATERAGAVTVHFVGGGKPWQGRIRPGTSTQVTVPPKAVAVRVEAAVPHVGAVVGQGNRGAAWLPLRELVVERARPDVRPLLGPDLD